MVNASINHGGFVSAPPPSDYTDDWKKCENHEINTLGSRQISMERGKKTHDGLLHDVIVSTCADFWCQKGLFTTFSCAKLLRKKIALLRCSKLANLFEKKIMSEHVCYGQITVWEQKARIMTSSLATGYLNHMIVRSGLVTAIRYPVCEHVNFLLEIYILVLCTEADRACNFINSRYLICIWANRQ